MVHQEKVCRDRGVELNQKRLQGILVDMVFEVEGVKFNAHRFIVSLYSPYLRTLVDPHGHFAENQTGQGQISLKGLDSEHFGHILTYIYTGQITIHEDNVFELVEICQYLQISDDDTLVPQCLNFLGAKLHTCPLAMVFKIWNLAEQYGFAELRTQVLSVLSFRLEDFLAKDFFMYLGFEEINQVLSHGELCIRSEKTLFDALISWLKRKANGEEDEDEEDQNDILSMTMELVGKLKLCNLSDAYVRAALKSISPKLYDPPRELDPFALRQCSNCVYMFEYSRCESEILGIQEFVSQRRDKPTYAYFDPCSTSRHAVAVLNAPTQSKSYFQHYGPHSSSNFEMITNDSEVLVIGGMKRGQRETSVSNDVKIFDLTTATWEHFGGSLPREVIEFGLLWVSEYIYVIGGLTDEYCRSAPNKVLYQNRPMNVSTEVYKIYRGDLTNLQGWTSLPPMLQPRTAFSVCQIGDQIFVIGCDFCDIFYMERSEWITINPPIDQDSVEKPALAVVGTQIYVFGNRTKNGENVFQCLDTETREWKRIPGLNFRLDVIAAFAHNNLVYLLSWQRSNANMIHSYNPVSLEWKAIVLNLPGTVRAGTLIRRQVLEENFFYGAKPLHCTELENIV